MGFTETEVQFILGLSDSHDLFVIFDECYLDMVFNGKKHISPLGDVRDNVVCCRGFSKGIGSFFAMPSWRASVGCLWSPMAPCMACSSTRMRATSRLARGRCKLASAFALAVPSSHQRITLGSFASTAG